MNLAEAGALAAILSAAERNAPVARDRAPGGDVLYGEARYIGIRGAVRDPRAEAKADVLDLYLVVQLMPGCLEQGWSVRQLTAEYLAGTFVTDCRPATARWFAEAKSQGCTGTGFNAGDDTILHDGAPPCPVHEPGSRADDLREARDWIADCWPHEETGDLTDAQVIEGVNRHYEGGWAAFVTANR